MALISKREHSRMLRRAVEVANRAQDQAYDLEIRAADARLARERRRMDGEAARLRRLCAQHLNDVERLLTLARQR